MNEGGIKQISAGVLGAGAWGKAFAHVLESSGWKVTIWSRSIGKIQSINNGTLDMLKAVDGVDLIVSAVPCPAVREVCQALKKASIEAPILSLTKGLEPETSLRATQIIEAELGLDKHIAALAGPNLASEVAKDLPAVSVLACRDMEIARFLAAHISNKNFAIRPSGDVVGVEISGVYKNVLSIAIGLSRGAELGENFTAALMTAGVREMAMFGVAEGAGVATFYGPAGLGDLAATSNSDNSRNYSFGKSVAKNESVEIIEGKTVEGVSASEGLVSLAAEKGIEVPIANTIAKLLQNDIKVDTALRRLQKAVLK